MGFERPNSHYAKAAMVQWRVTPTRQLLADNGPKRPPHAEPLSGSQALLPLTYTVFVAKNGWRFFSASNRALLGDVATGQLFACGFG